MLEVTINGELKKVPQCTCGKCIVRRMRKNEDPSIPYPKDLASVYTTDYPPKKPIKDSGFYNRSKLSGFDNKYKETLPGGLTSTMKADYIPYDVDLNDNKKPAAFIPSAAFIGPTTNEIEYLNWGSVGKGTLQQTKFPDINIPLRGQSNYTENYIKHPADSYKVRDAIRPKDTQMAQGNLGDATTYNTDYVPHEVNYNKVKPLESNNFLTADNPPDNFDTTYKINYIDYDDKMCRLRKYLNSIGMRYLVI